MAYKSPFNQDPTLKKTISNVFGKTNLPNFSDKKYGGERLYEQPVKGSDYSVPVSDFSDQIGGALAGSTTSTPKGRIDRLKARKDATSNEAKKARIQGKIERTKTRQSSRAERIKDKNIKRLQKTKQRQKIKNIRQGLDANAGMKDYKSEFKKMGEDFGKKDLSIKKSSSLSDVTSKTEFVPSSGGASSITPKTKITGALGSDLRKKQYDDAGFKYDDTIKGYNKDGSEIEVPATRGRGKFGPVSMKDEGAPTKMLGTMIAPIASRLQAALGIDAGGNPTRQRSGNILKDAGVLIGAGTRAAGAAPVDPVAPMTPTGGDMQDPFAGKTFSIVESPANMKGNAKPVFNESTSDAAAMMYGSPLERQVSMPKAGTSAMSMKDIPEGTKGAGLRALDDSVVEQMGYDSATKMMSPLDSHHKYKAPEGGNAYITKTLTKKPKKTTGLRRAASVLVGGLSETAAEFVERVRDYNNPPQQNFTKEKTNMPKKRVPRVNPGYVTDINTGERIGVEEIPFKDFKQR